MAADDAALAAWREQVAKDAGGRTSAQLCTVLADGVTIEPLFIADDRQPPPAPGQPPFVRGTTPQPGTWQATRRIDADLAAAGASVAGGLDAGWDAVCLRCPELMALRGATSLAAVDELSVRPVVLAARPAGATMHLLARLDDRGSALPVVFEQFAELQGLPPAIELALAAGHLVDALRSYDRDPKRQPGHNDWPEVAPAEVARRVALPLVVGTEVITEIAKVRAGRWLWTTVMRAFGVDDAPPRIYVRGSSHTWSAADPHLNLVRAALQGFAAVAGGCDWLEPMLHDPAASAAESARLALNQLRMLRHEAGLQRVVDPTGGSHAVEALTRRIADAAWELVQRLEAAGGYTDAGGRREDLLGAARARGLDAVAAARRNRVVVGGNRFVDADAPSTAAAAELPPERLAARFEALRQRAAALAPRALLLPAGATGAAMADWAADFLRAGGFAVTRGEPGVDLDADWAALAAWHGEVVVLCVRLDEAGAALAQRFARRAGPGHRRPLCYVTGPPPAESEHWGAVGFLHRGLDAVGTLGGILDRLVSS